MHHFVESGRSSQDQCHCSVKYECNAMFLIMTTIILIIVKMSVIIIVIVIRILMASYLFCCLSLSAGGIERSTSSTVLIHDFVSFDDDL